MFGLIICLINKDCHHEKTDREAKKVKQMGICQVSGNHNRSMLPKELCIEILKQNKYD